MLAEECIARTEGSSRPNDSIGQWTKMKGTTNSVNMLSVANSEEKASTGRLKDPDP